MATEDAATSAATYAGAGEPQLTAPMPPGIVTGIGEMLAGTTHVARDHTPRTRSAPPIGRSALPAVFALNTPVKGAADEAVPDSPPPTPVKAEPGLKRAASPSAPAGRTGVPDPWTQARAQAQEPTLAHVKALMATMQQTIDMLKEQLTDLKAEKGKDKEKNDEMPTMHHKDVEKPSKFSGKDWASWNMDFMTFLSHKNPRWKKILLKIQSISHKPLDSTIDAIIKQEAQITKDEVLEAYKFQLYEYLKSYTTGDANTLVIANNPENSFESWRRMCDQGNSIRDRPLRDERRTIFHPKQATADGLIKAIADWEKRLNAYVTQRPNDTLGPEDKIMCLEDMCPEPVQKFLADQHFLGMIKTYEEYKDAIDRFFYQEKRWNRKEANLHQCTAGCSDGTCQNSGSDPETGVWGGTGLPTEEPAGETPEEDDNQGPWATAIVGQVMAIMKGKGKSNKGKGKGADGKNGVLNGQFSKNLGKGKGPCYECGGDHLAFECAIRKARVESGGPAILPDNPNGPKGKGGKNGGKNGKGNSGNGGWWPTAQTWNQF